MLLHGFPDFSYGWREQMPAIAAAGFRAVAPDMRGYNRSDKPRGVAAYDLAHLADDIAALIGALGHDRAHAVIGHDWGGIVAWQLAATHRELVDRLVIVNAPHPRVLRRELRTLDQLVRSSYAVFFQLPVLPELLLRANGYALVLRALRREVHRPGALTDADVERHRDALAQPGALTAMLNYYRATGRRMIGLRRPRRRASSLTVQPTLIVWGDLDPFLNQRFVEGLEQWVPALRVVRFPTAGHWVHLDEPERVNAEITGFLTESLASRSST